MSDDLHRRITKDDDLHRWMTTDENARIADMKSKMNKLELKKLQLESEVQRIRHNAERRKENGCPPDFDGQREGPQTLSTLDFLEPSQRAQTTQGDTTCS